MPQITGRRIGLALDVAGCPNRCRHCWLTGLPAGAIDEATIRETVRRFREHVPPGAAEPRFACVQVSSWLREPDFSPDYRRLRELELELSDEPVTEDWELLSVWRLARDEGYARCGRLHPPDRKRGSGWVIN